MIDLWDNVGRSLLLIVRSMHECMAFLKISALKHCSIVNEWIVVYQGSIKLIIRWNICILFYGSSVYEG